MTKYYVSNLNKTKLKNKTKSNIINIFFHLVRSHVFVSELYISTFSYALRPFHTNNDNYKVKYISVHTNARNHSVYSKHVLQLCCLLL